MNKKYVDDVVLKALILKLAHLSSDISRRLSTLEQSSVSEDLKKIKQDLEEFLHAEDPGEPENPSEPEKPKNVFTSTPSAVSFTSLTEPESETVAVTSKAEGNPAEWKIAEDPKAPSWATIEKQGDTIKISNQPFDLSKFGIQHAVNRVSGEAGKALIPYNNVLVYGRKVMPFKLNVLGIDPDGVDHLLKSAKLPEGQDPSYPKPYTTALPHNSKFSNFVAVECPKNERGTQIYAVPLKCEVYFYGPENEPTPITLPVHIIQESWSERAADPKISEVIRIDLNSVGQEKLKVSGIIRGLWARDYQIKKIDSQGMSTVYIYRAAFESSELKLAHTFLEGHVGGKSMYAITLENLSKWGNYFDIRTIEPAMMQCESGKSNHGVFCRPRIWETETPSYMVLYSTPEQEAQILEELRGKGYKVD